MNYPLGLGEFLGLAAARQQGRFTSRLRKLPGPFAHTWQPSHIPKSLLFRYMDSKNPPGPYFSLLAR